MDIYNKYCKYHQGEAFLFSKDAGEKKFIWFETSKDTYAPAEILSEDAKNVTARLPDGKEVKVEKEKANFMNPPKFDGVEDCAQLSHLNEPAVLDNLRKRYNADIIYVYPLLKFVFSDFSNLFLDLFWVVLCGD